MYSLCFLLVLFVKQLYSYILFSSDSQWLTHFLSYQVVHAAFVSNGFFFQIFASFQEIISDGLPSLSFFFQFFRTPHQESTKPVSSPFVSYMPYLVFHYFIVIQFCISLLLSLKCTVFYLFSGILTHSFHLQYWESVFFFYL